MLPRDKRGRDLLTGHVVSGIEAARAWFGLLCWTAGTFVGDAKGKAQARNARLTVPMRHQGAEQLVVVLKFL